MRPRVDDLDGRPLHQAAAAGSWTGWRAERLAPVAARAAIGLVRARHGHAIYLEGLDAGDGVG